MLGATQLQRGYRVRAALEAIAGDGALAVEHLSPLEVVGRPVSGAWLPGRVHVSLTGAALHAGPFPGTVEPRSHAPGGPASVRVVFDSPPLDQGRAILALLQTLKAAGHVLQAPPKVLEERIVDPRRITSIVRQIFEQGCECRVSATGGVGTSLWAHPAKLLPGSPLPLAWEMEPPWPKAPLEISSTWMNWDFSLRIAQASAADGLVRTSLPDEIVRVRNRLLRRVIAPAGASIRFVHPLWPELVVRQPLRDISIHGASFSTTVVQDGVFPGLELPVVELSWPWGDRARFRGTVRHLSPGVRGEPVVCGVALEPASHEDDLVWRAATDRLFYSYTSLAPRRAEPMWELFDKSGYFNLSGKTTPEFASLREAFTRVTTSLGRPNDVGCHVVLENGELAHSSITMIKPYAHSWLACQLARRMDGQPEALSARRVLLETLLHGFEYPLRDLQFRWFVNWVQESSRWSRWMLRELTGRFIDDTDRTCILRFQAMEGRCDAENPFTVLGYTIETATPDEVGQLLDVIAGARPLSYREAHDLVPERVCLTEMQHSWARVGMARRREIVVARRAGQAVAAGILELGEDGVHLFGLLDVVRTFALAPGGAEAFGAILEAAREWYRAAGKQKFAYFVEHEDLAHAERAGMLDLGGADLLVIGSDLMSDQLEHIWEITAPRDTPPLRAEAPDDVHED